MAADRPAVQALNVAGRVVGSERGNQHGGAEDSFLMISQFWTVYLNHRVSVKPSRNGIIEITPVDVAEMMSLLKKARKVHGNGHPDSHVDDLGYTALAAELSGFKGPLEQGEADLQRAPSTATVTPVPAGDRVAQFEAAIQEATQNDKPAI